MYRIVRVFRKELLLNMFAVILSVLYMSLAVHAGSKPDPCTMSVESGGDLVWRRDSEDCSSAYLCLLGKTVTYTCPEGFVIGAGTTDCVPVGSAMDDCTRLRVPSDLENHKSEPCKAGSKSPDEDNCGKYFECVELPDGNVSKIEKECEYPMLFDTQSMKCESYHVVVCKPDQNVPKSQCDYEAFQCMTGHCVPCSIRFPSCNGLPDGMNSWMGREWSPYYVVCEEERVTLQGECSGEKETKVFHPEQKQCVIYDEKTMVG